ncbi:hypothetical protein NW767_014838 [Fusarium falciforme]|nr:hypothetical protein NW767_014838 [Fusarium falciforme]
MTAIVICPTQAAPNMTPEHEVKLLLKPTAVLGPDNELTSAILSTFDTLPTVTKLNSARVRKTENEDDFELTYKTRYAITGGDINAPLTTANIDEFDAGDTKYEAQVEWGYQKQHSISARRPRRILRTAGWTCRGRAIRVGC